MPPDLGPFLGIEYSEALSLRGHHKELEDMKRGSQEVSSHSFLRVIAPFPYSSILAAVTQRRSEQGYQNQT